MTKWEPYRRQSNSSVVGDLRVWQGLYSPQLNNAREVYVWLPTDYEASARRYPVVYMHDAQNLFDKATSYSGDSEWEVDETMTALSEDGFAAIIVGLPNMREMRGSEYSPYDWALNDKAFRGAGDAYIDFIVETVKPLIDRHFRTQVAVRATGIAGSSMGGLISLYGFLKHPDVFDFCGVFSPAYWFGNDGLLTTTQRCADGHGRIYLDVGTHEGETLAAFNLHQDDLDAAYVAGVRALRDALVPRGYVLGDNLMYIEEEGALHREAAWARRLPNALRFMLKL